MRDGVLTTRDSSAISYKSFQKEPSPMMNGRDGVLTTGDSSAISYKSFQKEPSPMTNGSESTLITIVMTRKMFDDEKRSGGNGRFWPKNTTVRGSTLFRTMQLNNDNDIEQYKDWLESYGCVWDTV
jgi:hypothetical protein